MTTLHVFQWLDTTLIGNTIRDSTYIFPVVEVFHLFGLTLLLGTLTITDLRMLGVGMRRQSIAEVASQLAPWTIWGAVVTIVSGILLFLSEAMKCYANAAFPWKMWMLLAGVLLYLCVQLPITRAKSRTNPALLKAVALLSLVFWYGVAVAGRAIAFV
ncbi:MAG TPA: DUF6644 family protein [Bryobacteraceae bacterium]|jgi:hypothetical protein|nr:DUF6644 family protein [Bryobacteraceae bacterium]